MDESVRDLEQDLELANSATPGPWEGIEDTGVKHPRGDVFETGCGCCTQDYLKKADADFIAEAREALPYWLVEVKRLRELTDALGDEVLGANADLAKANIALRTENERLREALDEIANPVKRMRDEAERKGARLNGLAIQLANNAAFLRNIARDALEVRNG